VSADIITRLPDRSTSALSLAGPLSDSRGAGRWPLYRDIIKHTGTYGLATTANSLAAALLLPVYTRYLSAAEYGVIAILDLTTQLLAVVLGGGLTTAVIRFSSEANSADERDRVWGTALIYASAMGLLALALGLPASASLARLTLGSASYAHLYHVLFVSFLVGMVGMVPGTYLLATKHSALASFASVGRLLVSVSLNVWLIVFLRWGVEGFLYSGLAAAMFFAVATSAYMLRHVRLRFSRPLLRDMLRFGAPLVPGVLCAAVMHEGDRLILQRYLGMSEVGIYSLGYKIAMMTSFLVLVPFGMTWSTVLYEVDRRRDAAATFARIMGLCTYLVTLVMVILSLFAREIVELLTGPEFHEAYRVIPIISLAYVFYSMHDHFRVPSLLMKKTGVSVIVYAVGAGSNLILNLALIPRYGYMGAALATAASFAIFAGTALVCYRRLYAIPYPLGRICLVLLMSLPCFGAGALLGGSNAWPSLLVRIAALIAFAVFLCWAASASATGPREGGRGAAWAGIISLAGYRDRPGRARRSDEPRGRRGSPRLI